MFKRLRFLSKRNKPPVISIQERTQYLKRVALALGRVYTTTHDGIPIITDPKIAGLLEHINLCVITSVPYAKNLDIECLEETLACLEGMYLHYGRPFDFTVAALRHLYFKEPAPELEDSAFTFGFDRGAPDSPVSTIGK